MQILTPQEVKKGSTAAEDEARARARDFATEEARLVASINSLRVVEEDSKKRVAEELEKDQAMLSVRKTVLSAEVDALEARKKEALRPVKELEEEAQRVLTENTAYCEVLDRRAADLNKRDDELTERVEEVSDQRQELAERGAELDRRESGIKVGEEEVKRSTTALAEKWVEYHGAVTALAEARRNIEEREIAVATAAQANQTAREENAREASRLGNERRAIQDGYRALEQAKEHLGIK